MSGSHEPGTSETTADVELAKHKVWEILVFLVNREDRELVGHEVVVLVPLKSLTTMCEP